MKKKKFPVFVIFLLVLVAVGAGLTIYGWNEIDVRLEEYQFSLPERVIDEYYSRLAKGDYSVAMAFAGYEPGGFCTEEKFAQWLDGRYQSQYTDLRYLRSVGASGEEETGYTVYAQTGTELGHIWVRPSGQTTEHGFELWEVCGADKAEFTDETTVTVPEGAKITVNGVSVPEDYPSETITIPDFPEYKGYPSPTERKYTFFRLPVNSEFSVTSASGENCAEKHSSVHELHYEKPEKHREEIESLAEEAITVYSTAVHIKGESEVFLTYLLPETDFYKTMQDYHKWWVIFQPDYKSAEILDLRFTDYEEYSDDRTEICLAFDYKIVSKVLTDTFPAAYRIRFVRTDDGWKIADMEVI